jgi:acyl-coenzyme A synthetase/AMP-(fatty) acid ligase
MSFSSLISIGENSEFAGIRNNLPFFWLIRLTVNCPSTAATTTFPSALLPTQVKQILNHEASEVTDFSSLHYVTCGGDEVSVHLQEKFFQTTRVNLSIGLGMTECGGYMTTPPGMPFKFVKIGLPVYQNQVELRTEDGRLVQAGACVE